MAVSFPDEAQLALVALWEYYFEGSFNPTLKLFQNNATISASTVLADLTEADYSGYVAQGIATWTTPQADGSNRKYTESTTVKTFAHDGGGTANTIYGWYLIDSNSGDLLAVHKFDTPVVMDDATDTIDARPRLQLYDQCV